MLSFIEYLPEEPPRIKMLDQLDRKRFDSKWQYEEMGECLLFLVGIVAARRRTRGRFGCQVYFSEEAPETNKSNFCYFDTRIHKSESESSPELGFFCIMDEPEPAIAFRFLTKVRQEWFLSQNKHRTFEVLMRSYRFKSCCEETSFTSYLSCGNIRGLLLPGERIETLMYKDKKLNKLCARLLLLL